MAYFKIQESSQTLLEVIKRESATMYRKREPSLSTRATVRATY